MRESPEINIVDFGATPNEKDETTRERNRRAFENAIAAAWETNATIVFPEDAVYM